MADRAAKRWELSAADSGSKALDDALESGWEPFAAVVETREVHGNEDCSWRVTGHERVTVILLRREVVRG